MPIILLNLSLELQYININVTQIAVNLFMIYIQHTGTIDITILVGQHRAIYLHSYSYHSTTSPCKMTRVNR